MKNKIFLGAIVAIAANGAYALSIDALGLDPTLNKIKATKTLNIAVRESSLPLSYLLAQPDGTKKPIGMAVDICNAVAERIKTYVPDLKVNYITVTSSTRIPAIKEGKADMECGSTTNSASRRKEVTFSIPYYIASITGAVRSDSSISTLDDLEDGAMVVYTKGTTTEDTVRKFSIGFNNRAKLGAVRKTVADDHMASFNVMARGEARVFLNDDILLYGLMAQTENPGQFKLLNQIFTLEPYGIMSRKDSALFSDLINDTIITMMNSGEYKSLYAKWFQSPIPPKNVTLNVPMSKALRDVVRFPTDVVGN